MAARVRNPTATPGPSNRISAGSAALPQYEHPSFPLNPTAQRALASLVQKHNLRKFEDSITSAQAELGTAVSDIYDSIRTKANAVENRRRRFNQGTGRDTADDEIKTQEDEVAKLQERAKQMNERMEEQLRKLIDAKASVRHLQTAVDAAEQAARNNASTQASTQRGRARQDRRAHEDGEDEDDGEVEDFTPTDPAGGTQPPTAPTAVFQKRLDTEKLRYQARSFTERYAETQEYADFKRLVHDSMHPNDELELAPPDQWFEEGRPAPGVTQHVQNGDDSDDDIAIARATISTKCPLSLRELEVPWTSKKCPHTFERAHILDMIKRSPTQDAQRRKYAQCPVPGCSQQLTEQDVHKDPLVTRRIKRLQAAAKSAEEDDDEDDEQPDGTQRRGHLIDSDAVDTDDLDHPPPASMKSEPPPSRVSAMRSGQSGGPRRIQVIDMGDDDDDDDDHDDDDDDHDDNDDDHDDDEEMED